MSVLRQASREDVLDIAIRVFSERGFGETSLRQLIAETGMSPTAFYARYRSKQAVLEALVERLVSRVFLTVSTAFTTATSVDAAFGALPEVLMRELPPQKAVVRLMITEAAVLPSLRRTLHGAYRTLAGLVGSALEKAKMPMAGVAGWAMFGAVYAQMMRWALFEELDDDGFAEQLRLTTRMLRATVPT